MAATRIDNNNAVGIRNSSSSGRTAGVKRKHGAASEEASSSSGNDAAVKVELSEEGKRLAAKAAAGASEIDGTKPDSPPQAVDHLSKLGGAEQEFENLVQYYAKKIAKAARALDHKESSAPAATRPRKEDVEEIG